MELGGSFQSGSFRTSPSRASSTGRAVRPGFCLAMVLPRTATRGARGPRGGAGPMRRARNTLCADDALTVAHRRSAVCPCRASSRALHDHRGLAVAPWGRGDNNGHRQQRPVPRHPLLPWGSTRWGRSRPFPPSDAIPPDAPDGAEWRNTHMSIRLTKG